MLISSCYSWNPGENPSSPLVNRDLLLCPWDFPGKSTGVGCHCLLQISQSSKVILKIQQAMLQQYMNRELPDVQTGFKKGRGTRDQIANIHWTIEKAR